MIEDGETLDAASALDLARLAAGVAGLEAIVVFLRAPSHVYAHWLSSGGSPSASRVASAAQPLLEASLGVATAFGAGRAPRAGTLLELDAHLVFVEPMGRFGAAFVFSSSAPLGLARLAVRRIGAVLDAELEQVASAGRARPLEPPSPAKRRTSTPELAAAKTLVPTPNGERVRALLAELEAEALDPHLVRLRLALRSGLGREQLSSPDTLPNEALRLIETLATELFDEARGRNAHPAGGAEP
jgi:hypothetical protein